MRLFTLLLLPVALTAGQPRYARMGDFQGTVEVQLRPYDSWTTAVRNLPLVESTWVRSGTASRAEIELDEGSVWRIGADSEAGIADYSRLSTGQRVTLLTLGRGVAYFTGQPQGRDSLLLVAPGAEIAITRGARVRIEAGEQSSRISVLAGVARFSSPAAEMDLHEGQSVRVDPAHPARFVFDRELAPMDLDRWNEVRDHALAGSASAAHVPEHFGAADLDAAGEWVSTDDLGTVWKPKAPQGWAPFQKGRWLWYDGLGYTWVSADDWGWLPYHYGRWLRKTNLGWVWVPTGEELFKPGDVYWLRANGIAGWGPLAPGEAWSPGRDKVTLPQQYLDANTTYAVFEPGAAEIDPAGFTARPKEPLRTMTFAEALPSPAFLAAKLEARRPTVEGDRNRVAPYVSGTAFESTTVSSVAPAAAVIITQAAAPVAPPAPAAPEVVPYPVPVVVPSVIVVEPPAQPIGAPRPKAPPQPQADAVKPVSRRSPSAGSAPPARRDPRRTEEDAAAEQIAAKLIARNYSGALADLDTWNRHYPDSLRKMERTYYFLQAYDGLNQTASAVAAGGVLLRDTEGIIHDPLQVLTVLYLTTANFHKLSNPTREQSNTGRTAAQRLLAFLPTCFAPQNRPVATSEKDWGKARSDFETLAKSTLATAGKRDLP